MRFPGDDRSTASPCRAANPHRPPQRLQADLPGHRPHRPAKGPGSPPQARQAHPAPDGTWTVVDLGTENGITVNGRDVPSGDSVPLRPGDRIHLGAWTKITITRG